MDAENDPMQTIAPKLQTREASMLRISEIEWNGGQGLQDLSIHGIGPTKAMAEHLAGILEQPRPDDTPEARAAILDAILDSLNEAERALNRFGKELVKPMSPQYETENEAERAAVER